ncbi:plasmid recombination protein [Microbacteriaceae bacterium K1510]|nr:plasmid recombination protein [Microbacteriaceae bacterium K1510]
MASQFIHIGVFGRFPRKGEPAWSCITGITAEGARAPGACGHVPYPAEPALLHGVSPLMAGKGAIEHAERAVDAKGRRLRRDGVALIAGIVSYPVERVVVDGMIGDADFYRYWLYEVVEWLRAQFGRELRSVVEHSDEKYYHVHFYVVPSLGEDRRLNLDVIHAGRRAKTEAAAAGADKKAQEAAYRDGMRRFQDRFWEDVSRHFGHDRFGPRRARIARKERLAERALEEERVRLREAAEREIAQEAAQARAEAHDRYSARMHRLKAAYADEMQRRLAAEHELARVQAQLAELTASRGLAT